jgi:hypothetical protein
MLDRSYLETDADVIRNVRYGLDKQRILAKGLLTVGNPKTAKERSLDTTLRSCIWRQLASPAGTCARTPRTGASSLV